MTTYILIGVIILNIPVYLLLGKTFFGGWVGFLESFLAMFRSDLGAAMSGDYEGHQIGKFTLVLFVVTIVFTTVAEYYIIARFLFGLEEPWNFG